MYDFENMHPSPWTCPVFCDGCVFDDRGNVVCVVDDNETRALIAASPTMLQLIEKYAASPNTPQAMREECQKLSDDIRKRLWLKGER